MCMEDFIFALFLASLGFYISSRTVMFCVLVRLQKRICIFVERGLILH